MCSTVVVHYRFHPLVGRTLSVLRDAKRAEGSITVRSADDTALKIPTWMLQQEVASFDVSAEPAGGAGGGGSYSSDPAATFTLRTSRGHGSVTITPLF